jgi:hypothetical protein
MKKLVVILVVFTVLAGAAFAAPSVGGTVETRWTVFSTSTEDGSDVTTQGIEAAGYAQLSGANDDGTFGATVRLRAGTENRDVNVFHKIYAWWKPIDQFRFWLGRDPDGVLNTNELARWSFHATNDYVCMESWDYDMAFPGNWDQFGAWFSIYPTDGVDLNVVVDLETRGTIWNPTTNINKPISIKDGATQGLDDKTITGASPWETKSGDFFPSRLQFVGGFGIPDMGKLYVVYRGNAYRDTDAGYGHAGASFFLNGPVDGLQAQFGVATTIPEGDALNPLYIGLAAHYKVSTELGVNFRSQFALGLADGASTNIKAEFKPWYNLGSAFVAAQIGLKVGVPSEGDSTIGWHFNPYIKVGNFYAGFKIVNADTNGPVTISMPLGIAYGF